MLWVGGIAFAVGRIAEATAIVIGDWGVAWGAQALEVAGVHLQAWVIVALDDVMHLLARVTLPLAWHRTHNGCRLRWYARSLCHRAERMKFL